MCECLRHFLTLMPEILAKFQSMLMTYHIHLLYFLHNPIVLQSFTMHLRSEHSEENILFWLACRELRALDPSTVDQSQIDLQARAIETRFIGDQAPMQVNLKGTVEKKIRAGLKETPIKRSARTPTHRELRPATRRKGPAAVRATLPTRSPAHRRCQRRCYAPGAVVRC